MNEKQDSILSISSKNSAIVSAIIIKPHQRSLLLMAFLGALIPSVNASQSLPASTSMPTPNQAESKVLKPVESRPMLEVSPVPTNTKATPAPAAKPACTSMKAPYRSGLWEIISTSNNSLMPQPITARIKRCVSEHETQNACGLNQLAGGRNHDCQLVDMHITNNKATWSMRCDGERFNAKAHGESTFLADSYHGSFSMNTTMQGKPMQINTTFVGQRLRNCK